MASAAEATNTPASTVFLVPNLKSRTVAPGASSSGRLVGSVPSQSEIKEYFSIVH